MRETASGMLACEGKLNHLGIDYCPPKSSLADVNIKRPSEVFGLIYGKLYKTYRGTFLSDSFAEKELLKRLFLIDSTVISLFKEVLKCTGRKNLDGKSKGGIKAHTMMNAYEGVPQLVYFSSAAVHDHVFLKKIKLEKNQIGVFDKGYVDYVQFAEWTKNNVFFVTRLKENAKYEGLEELDIPDDCNPGVIKDELISISYKDEQGKQQSLTLRRVAYWDDANKKLIVFLTNMIEFDAGLIVVIYKYRWQIELLFKQLKQNFPLKYFLGDNQNAIEIQIWCTLIVNLLYTIIKNQLKKKWAFSNIATIIRLHLFSYVNIFSFLNNPEKSWINKIKPKTEAHDLFNST